MPWLYAHFIIFASAPFPTKLPLSCNFSNKYFISFHLSVRTTCMLPCTSNNKAQTNPIANRTMGWTYTEGTWFYCDYLIWFISCTVVVITCCVVCVCVCVCVCVYVCVCVCVSVCVNFVMCGWFRDMCTRIYCVLYCLYCVFILYRLCIFILICFVCTSVRTTTTEWKLNCNNNNNNNNIYLLQLGCHPVAVVI
jgi:hypothetical protein